MTDPENARAIAALDRKIMKAKRDVKEYKARGLDVPDWLRTKIKHLSDAAYALRNDES